jgi:hypothetical protein
MLRFLNTTFDPLDQFERPKDRSKAQGLAFPNMNISSTSVASIKRKILP